MQTDRRQRLLIFGTVACFALLMGDRLVINPLTNVWKKWEERIETAKRQVNEGGPSAEHTDDWRKTWDEKRKQGLPQQMPKAESEIFADVAQWATRNGMTPASVKPHWSEDKKTGTKTVEFVVTGKGAPASVYKFLYALETAPKALRVEKVLMTTGDPKAGSQVTLEVRFTGLVLPEEKS